MLLVCAQFSPGRQVAFSNISPGGQHVLKTRMEIKHLF